VPGVGKHNLFVVGSNQSNIDRLMARLKSHPAVRPEATKVPLAWLRLQEIDGHPNRSGKQMWFATCGDQAKGTVRVSQDRAQQLGIKSGSNLRFITGRGEIRATAEVEQRHNSVEDVVYGFVLACSALESTPLFYYGGVWVDPPEQVGAVRRWLAEQEPSAATLSALELRQISQRTAADTIGMLRTLSGLALAGGVVLLALLVAASQPSRWTDLAIFRVLGGGRWRLIGMLAVEFGLLSIAAIVGGTLAGSILTSLALSTFLKRATFELSIAWGESLARFLVWTAAGIVACLPALGRRPLQVLRED
jgi:predicted lysophospholipase L1 biosynthesis ABC-type transport system permease subunit